MTIPVGCVRVNDDARTSMGIKREREAKGEPPPHPFNDFPFSNKQLDWFTAFIKKRPPSRKNDFSVSAPLNCLRESILVWVMLGECFGPDFLGFFFDRWSQTPSTMSFWCYCLLMANEGCVFPREIECTFMMMTMMTTTKMKMKMKMKNAIQIEKHPLVFLPKKSSAP